MRCVETIDQRHAGGDLDFFDVLRGDAVKVHDQAAQRVAVGDDEQPLPDGDALGDDFVPIGQQAGLPTSSSIALSPGPLPWPASPPSLRSPRKRERGNIGVQGRQVAWRGMGGGCPDGAKECCRMLLALDIGFSASYI